MFDIEKAERVRDFIETYCTFTKGIWINRPFKLLPWQYDRLIKPFFGTLNEEGLRQYKTAYLEIGKKNGKSMISAAISLYMLIADEEGAPEVYIAAADVNQASIIYDMAAKMVTNSPFLSQHIQRVDYQKTLRCAANDGLLKVLSSDVKSRHGLSPSAIVVDELHAHPNADLS